MQPPLCTSSEIRDNLQMLNAWELEANTLKKVFTFRDFTAAFGFMTQVAIHADKLNHHPDWENTYNRVSITLSTHEAGGLTLKDFELAKRIDTIL